MVELQLNIRSADGQLGRGRKGVCMSKEVDVLLEEGVWAE